MKSKRVGHGYRSDQSYDQRLLYDLPMRSKGQLNKTGGQS